MSTSNDIYTHNEFLERLLVNALMTGDYSVAEQIIHQGVLIETWKLHEALAQFVLDNRGFVDASLHVFRLFAVALSHYKIFLFSKLQLNYYHLLGSFMMCDDSDERLLHRLKVLVELEYAGVNDLDSRDVLPVVCCMWKHYRGFSKYVSDTKTEPLCSTAGCRIWLEDDNIVTKLRDSAIDILQWFIRAGFDIHKSTMLFDATLHRHTTGTDELYPIAIWAYLTEYGRPWVSGGAERRQKLMLGLEQCGVKFLVASPGCDVDVLTIAVRRGELAKFADSGVNLKRGKGWGLGRRLDGMYLCGRGGRIDTPKMFELLPNLRITKNVTKAVFVEIGSSDGRKFVGNARGQRVLDKIRRICCVLFDRGRRKMIGVEAHISLLQTFGEILFAHATQEEDLKVLERVVLHVCTECLCLWKPGKREGAFASGTSAAQVLLRWVP